MAHTKVLSHEPLYGTTTYMHFNNDGTVTFETVQHDCTPILEQNKAETAVRGKNTRGKDMFKVASIPPVILMKWADDYHYDLRHAPTDEENWPLVRRLLNSSDWRYLRTSEVYI